MVHYQKLNGNPFFRNTSGMWSVPCAASKRRWASSSQLPTTTTTAATPFSSSDEIMGGWKLQAIDQTGTRLGVKAGFDVSSGCCCFFSVASKEKKVLKSSGGKKFPHFRFVDWPTKFKKNYRQKTLFWWRMKYYIANNDLPGPRIKVRLLQSMNN